ncbi:MAG: hypothetical protein Q7T50_02005, partial [Candidatus Magasanikbacteria bacterium]|nr:hypothetical protein [Candidatus Magasanikbacteria bacterium]
MLYLIGGSPRGGKTILSKKLSKKIEVPYISTDYLKLILRPYFKEKEREEMFPFDKIWKKLNLNEYFLNYTGKQMLTIDIKEGKTLWTGMKYLISHLSKRKIDYIIEGVHLLPNLIKDFKDNPNVKIIFLTKTDEEKIYSGLFKNKSERDWILEKVKDRDILKLVAKSLSFQGSYFEKETKK